MCPSNCRTWSTQNEGEQQNAQRTAEPVTTVFFAEFSVKRLSKHEHGPKNEESSDYKCSDPQKSEGRPAEGP